MHGIHILSKYSMILQQLVDIGHQMATFALKFEAQFLAGVPAEDAEGVAHAFGERLEGVMELL